MLVGTDDGRTGYMYYADFIESAAPAKNPQEAFRLDSASSLDLLASSVGAVLTLGASDVISRLPRCWFRRRCCRRHRRF